MAELSVGSVLRKPAVAALLVLLVACATYATTLQNGFLLDDGYIVVDNPQVRSLANIPELFAAPPPAEINSAYYRPVLLTTFALDYAIYGLRPAGFHATNVLIHAAASILALLLLRRLVRDDLAALLGALLFAVHPLQGEVVYLVNYRAVSLSTLCFFGALGVFLSGREHGFSPRALVALGALYFASLGSKETGVVLPAALLLADYLVPFSPALAPSEPTAEPATLRGLRARASVSAYATVIVVAIAYFAIRHALCAPSTTSYFGSTPALDVARTMIIVELHALSLLLWPRELAGTYDASYPSVPPHLTDPAVMLALACLVGIALAAFRLRRRAPLLSYAIAFYFVGLATTYQLVRLPILFGERFMYLPLFGLCLALAFALSRCPPALRAPSRVVVLVVLGAFAWSSAARARDWRDEESFWRATLEVRPSSIQAHVGLAALLASEKRCAEANPHFRFAVERRGAPGDRTLFGMAAQCQAAVGDGAAARRIVERWLRLHPADGGFQKMLESLDAQLRARSAQGAPPAPE